MSDPAPSLTGVWSGRYAYPFLGAEVEFTATLLEIGGSLSGTTHEIDLITSDGALLLASLDGRREGETVRFVKRYEETPRPYVQVFYEGVLGDDGHEIAGEWRLPDNLTGAFVMVRPRLPAVRERKRQAERA